MTWERPTLTELHEQAEATANAVLPELDTSLRRSNIKVLTSLRAGSDHLQYGYLTRMAKQIHVHSAEASYLEDLSAVWGIARKLATKASGSITLTGTVGTVVPEGTELRRADDVRYVTTAEVTLSGASTAAAVAASEAGDAGNAVAETPLAFTGYVNGLNSTAVADAEGFTGGAEEEEDDSLRARTLYRIQNPPMGGAESDYVSWCLECAGVTRAYCYPNRMGAGTVGVTFLMDNASYGPIPSAADLQRVEDYIEETDETGYPFRRPVTANVWVYALTAQPLDFEISLTIESGAVLADVQAAIQAELADLILREAEPEGGLLISHIREAVSIAAGEYDHELTAPAANVSAGAGEIITMGEITWS